jgi:HK97 family phage prohead protease
MEKELRYCKTTAYRTFEDDNKKRFISGYASVYGVKSKLLYEYTNSGIEEFYEIIERGAFANILATPDLDVIFNFNHKSDVVIARNTSGTLKLSEDEYGLKFEALVPNTTDGNNLYELIQRGDISENSFAFWVTGDDYVIERDEETKIPLRRIKNIAGLFDVSAVIIPAYPKTVLSTEVRSKLENIITLNNEKTSETTEDIYKDNENLVQRFRITKLIK